MYPHSFHRIQRVSPSCLHDFSCGVPNLDRFLVDDALDYAVAGLTQTVVVFSAEDPIPSAYFSLSTDGMPLDFVEKNHLYLNFDCPLNYFPAVKITKLAVRSSLQSKGMGTSLIGAIEGLAHTPQVSIRLLTVDAANNSRAMSFYLRHGFRISRRHEERVRTRRAIDGSVNAASHSVLMYRDLYDPEDAHPPASRWPNALRVEERLPNAWAERDARQRVVRSDARRWI